MASFLISVNLFVIPRGVIGAPAAMAEDQKIVCVSTDVREGTRGEGEAIIILDMCVWRRNPEGEKVKKKTHLRHHSDVLATSRGPRDG